ncbi:MAG: hypothetical protein KC503_14810 [Myxococcales bacterium]|nr:hypothetical protein [Myxococcales bacterium]
MTKTLTLTALFALTVSACGDVGYTPPNPFNPNDPTQPTTPWVNTPPSIHVASPGTMSVGDDMTILGNHFVEPKYGDVRVIFKGTFTDDQGQSNPVDMEVEPEWKSAAKLTWKLYPNVVFHPQGDRLGQFLGEVRVINKGKDGSLTQSNSLPVRVSIGPSLIPRVVRPHNSNCQSVVTGTLENTGFTLTVEAIGLRAATADTPLNFNWTLLRQNWTVAFSYGSFDPDSVLPKQGAVTIEERVTSGRSSAIQDGGNKNFFIKIGNDLIGNSRLKTLKTAPIPAEAQNQGHYNATVNVAVQDAAGKTARISIPIKVRPQAELIYDGASKIAERFPPSMVSDCIPGGDIGRNVSYREDNSESRSRGMSFNYNASAGLTLGLPSNPFALGLNLSAGFGVDVNASVSTTQSKALDISGQILPGQYAAFYRQTTRVYRIGRIVGNNQCGASLDLGEAILTDWIFTPELAHGASCPPPSNLPAAGKFIQ